MIGADMTNKQRKQIYRREGYRCALCGSPSGLQLHHYIPRSQGGPDNPQNVLALCPQCHLAAHGNPIDGWPDREDIEQAIVEYLEDIYLDKWNPYEREFLPF